MFCEEFFYYYTIGITFVVKLRIWDLNNGQRNADFDFDGLSFREITLLISFALCFSNNVR